MLRIYKVTGSSMLPVYQEGDFVLTSKIPAWARGVRSGDVIVFQHPLYGRLIKQVQQHDRQRDEITVRGLNDASVDSRDFGPLRARNVAGVVREPRALWVGRDSILWKIDCYDPTLSSASHDPADPAVTTRVRTIMLGEEY